MGTITMLLAVTLVGLLAPLTMGQFPSPPANRVRCDSNSQQTLSDFSSENLWGNETIEFSKYKGKVVLAYNAASG